MDLVSYREVDCRLGVKADDNYCHFESVKVIGTYSQTSFEI